MPLKTSAPPVRKPRIAVVASASARRKALAPYLEAIAVHDGEARVIRPGDRPDLHSLQGLMLIGGGDFGLRAYGRRALSTAERRTLRRVDPAREAFEQRLLRWARRARVPTLGICRGCQMLNVHAGGTLIPDLAAWSAAGGGTGRPLAHQPRGRASAPLHWIALRRGSRLRSIFGGRNRIRVNSRHHQAVDRLGRRLREVARSADGVVEAVEDPSRAFWIGVQFHPERLRRRTPVLDGLFRRFLECCRERTRRGHLPPDRERRDASRRSA